MRGIADGRGMVRRGRGWWGGGGGTEGTCRPEAKRIYNCQLGCIQEDTLILVGVTPSAMPEGGGGDRCV